MLNSSDRNEKGRSPGTKSVFNEMPTEVFEVVHIQLERQGIRWRGVERGVVLRCQDEQ